MKKLILIFKFCMALQAPRQEQNGLIKLSFCNAKSITFTWSLVISSQLTKISPKQMQNIIQI
jgi:hypothetical protein